MILKNLKIYSEGLIRKGSLLINDGFIDKIALNPNKEVETGLNENNKDNFNIDCLNKLAIPGIIDIHSHLRDMEQAEKETFLTGTKAAAYSGITTVFNMPNTKPPAIDAEIVQKWISRANNNIYVDVGFISGVPKEINESEINKIIKLGIIGFKIYPLNPLNDNNWLEEKNILKLLQVSSDYQIPIFIHPDWPLDEKKKKAIHENWAVKKYDILKLHNNLYPPEMELKYVSFILNCYSMYIDKKRITPEQYPIIHFCHISTKNSYSNIKRKLKQNPDLKISFEVTPHHLLLSNEIDSKNKNIAKVLPPLRNKEESLSLIKKLVDGKINLIGTDHAPHTLKEKSGDYLTTSSGFPGFETYPLTILNLVCEYKFDLETFVNVASENPARIFHLKNKGFIREGYDADLIIVDKISEYRINPIEFKTKAKYSPFENFTSQIQIWKVFLRGVEINKEDLKPMGKIIKSYRAN